MTSRDFAYWLQGLFELGNPATLNEQQTALVRQHLALVFKHEIDPSMGGPEKQAELNKLHGQVQSFNPQSVNPHGAVMRC